MGRLSQLLHDPIREVMWRDEGTKCFSCQKPLKKEDDPIFWQFYDVIWLHGSCCLDLITGLSNDFRLWSRENHDTFLKEQIEIKKKRDEYREKHERKQ